jgi:uncharacterized protein (TIGR03067 family)
MRLLTPTFALVLLAAGFASLTPAQDAKDNLIKQEWKKLQGTWALASLEVGGKAVPAEKLKEAAVKIIIDQGKTTILEGDKRQELSLTIDPSKSPKQIDAQGTGPGGREEQGLGIYQLDGDTLRVCYDPKEKQRPTQFKSKPGSNQVLETFRREKK